MVACAAVASGGVRRVTVPRTASALTNSLASWAAASTLMPETASAPPSSQTA